MITILIVMKFYVMNWISTHISMGVKLIISTILLFLSSTKLYLL